MEEHVENIVRTIALESHLIKEAEYSENSTAPPISRKLMKPTPKQHYSLVPNNVLKQLNDVNWETLCDTKSFPLGTFSGILELPVTVGRRIERMFVSEKERKSEGVLFWVDHHPYASWRLLITQLDKERKHSLASGIHQYAEKVTDHSFAHQNISMVTATVKDDELGDCLVVPVSIQDKIRRNTSSFAEYRVKIIEYYIQYSPSATWSDLTGRLYYWECPEAVAAARRFIKRTPETTLTFPNFNTLLARVSHDWWSIGTWMNIPSSKRREIREQHSSDAQHCSGACWELYVKEHPSPTWQRVAYALYWRDHLEELEVLQTKYLKGSARNYYQFEEAMKHGYIRSQLCKLLLYGAAGSGKSSVKEMILGNPPPINRTSTPLAMRPMTVYRINLDGKEWTKITTLEEHRLFLAQALLLSAPNLAHQMFATQPKEASSSDDQHVSTIAMKSKSQKSADHGRPPLLDDQPPSDSLELASLDHDELDEDNDSELYEILESISTDWELVKLMGLLSTTVDPLAFFSLLQMIDAGGQPQFHEVLPVFLRNLSFYIFVFRLCDDLAKHPVVEFYVDGKLVGFPFTSAQSTEQLLQHCVRCICSQRSPNSSENVCPQILVIGTHVDQEKKSSETRDEKNQRILQILFPLEQKQIIYHEPTKKQVVIPVNAKLPGNNEKDIVKQIRQTLLSEGMVEPIDIPSRWFALEILLKELAQALERGVLSRKDCITAATEKLHFEEDAVDAALQYLNRVSVILYHPRILPNVVFADPQVVLDKISELVFESVAPSKKISSGEWGNFCEHALVTEKFLSKDTFNSHYVTGLFEVNHLIVLFKKLLIFATFSATEYFVPALLRHLDGKAVDDHHVKCIPSLVLQFPGGGPRQGIFCALLCWLVSPENDSPAPWSISVDELGSPICLYRNCVQFDIPELASTVTLIDTYTHFEIQIDIPPEDAEDLCPEEFPVIRKAIDEGLHKATLNLGYFNSSPSSALLCPCGRGEAHAAEMIARSTRWKCSLKTETKKIGKLTLLQHLLIDKPATSRAKCELLTESHLPKLLEKLKIHACKW